MRTTTNQFRDAVFILVSALFCVFVFYVLFSVFVLLDPSYGYYHPEVLK